MSALFTVLAFPVISLLSLILVLTFPTSVPGVQFPQLINIYRTDVNRRGHTQADEGNPGNFRHHRAWPLSVSLERGSTSSWHGELGSSQVPAASLHAVVSAPLRGLAPNLEVRSPV